MTATNENRFGGLPDEIIMCLPERTARELKSVNLPCIDEIRLRCGGLCAVTSEGRNIPLKHSLTRRETDETVRRLCGGSMYAYAETIKKGYITVFGGVRVGVCGRAVTERGSITGVYELSSLCIRIPRNVTGVGSTVAELLRDNRFLRGVIVYSPPGEGKTTLLRSVIRNLAGGRFPIRVAVIDTRGELAAFLPEELTADILSGYPKAEGIETAARTLNPQLIVCDEIGGDTAEAAAVCAAHNCGVALLASTHALTHGDLMRRPAIRVMTEAGIFGYTVGICRQGRDYDYRVTEITQCG